jgi:hypothetical protein
VAGNADRRVCPYQAESSPGLVGTASRMVMSARIFPATTTVPRSARRQFNVHFNCIPHGLWALSLVVAGHTPTKIEGAYNPAPPEARKGS